MKKQKIMSILENLRADALRSGSDDAAGYLAKAMFQLAECEVTAESQQSPLEFLEHQTELIEQRRNEWCEMALEASMHNDNEFVNNCAKTIQNLTEQTEMVKYMIRYYKSTSGWEATE